MPPIAVILAVLCGLFALRVLGQAVQRWAPVSWLPAFGAFQGSKTPYWLLLSIQLVLLVLMIAVTRQVAVGEAQPNAATARTLTWFGAVYMTGCLGRLAVGLASPNAPQWFRTWIPSVFHVVLAGFVLALACYHSAG
jgi:hypothetical protein